MTVREIIIEGCQLENMSQTDLAGLLEYKSRGSVSTPLSRKDGMGMSVETLVRWLDALGGELVVNFVDHDQEYVLDGESEGVDYECNQKWESD